MTAWIPIDKNFRYFFPMDRPYTKLEAMVSYTIDMDEGKRISINGYSRTWNWSRNKVRKFLEEIKTAKGHPVDTQGTLWGHSVTFINNNLQKKKDTPRTPQGHPKDTPPKIKKEKYGEFVELLPEEYQKLVDKYQEAFTKACIERLDNYIGSSGKKYKSHYHCILNWVVEREIQTGNWVE
jgi:hypothetical protein